MSRYLYCGETVVSNIILPELPRSNNDETGLLFSLESPQESLADPLWVHHWLDASGEKMLSFSKQASFYWLQFPNLADFQISTTAIEISCFPLPEVPPETIRHLLLDQVLPRCLAHQGKIMLHASAVRHKQGLLLFIGDSGAGKSTLAGNFHLAGDPATGDDCVRIKEYADQIKAAPSYGGLRLWKDSLEVLFAAEQDTSFMAHYSPKKRVPLKENDGSRIGTDIPVLAVIVLSPSKLNSSSEISLERLSQRDAFIAMLKQTFQLNLMDLERMSRHARALGRIVPRLQTFRLSVPRDYGLLPTVRKKILEAVL